MDKVAMSIDKNVRLMMNQRGYTGEVSYGEYSGLPTWEHGGKVRVVLFDDPAPLGKPAIDALSIEEFLHTTLITRNGITSQAQRNGLFPMNIAEVERPVVDHELQPSFRLLVKLEPTKARKAMSMMASDPVARWFGSPLNQYIKASRANGSVVFRKVIG